VQNPVRIWEYTTISLKTCKTLRKILGERKNSAVLQTRLTKSIFRKIKSISSKDITNIKRNCVLPLRSRNMKTKNNNIISILIVFSIYVRDGERRLLSECNTIQPSISKKPRNHISIFKSKVTIIESVSTQSKCQPSNSQFQWSSLNQ
jgi:hypothetical protein